MIGLSQTPLADNTHHSQETDTNALCGIRTCSLSKWVATDRHLRLRGL